MAKNSKTKSGKGFRKGCVKNRTQFKNEKTGVYITRDKKTGRFVSGGKKTPYKNIRKEKA